MSQGDVAASKHGSGKFPRLAIRITMCEMDKIAWQKPFSSASDFAIKKSKKIHIFLI